MNKPEFKQQYQTGVNHAGDVESKITAVGLHLAVFIKQKWRRGLITSELNFNSFSISSRIIIGTVDEFI
ncbi:hypothetical protein T09_13979 [Trichinella sp. T9]|uniref:Uncharacterized protein n=1 Tax=Trichinella murrelli TaxID=144512 RepID=A0A0V0THP8_9BILA|nr:hypothetical protein T05_3438 [Trichinella murrelli]KRX64456.1 hypothetical protein T09_13979 [Trichinella sp. T9]